jgi:hypothetical protein
LGRAQDVVSTTEQLIADIFEQYSQESENELDFDTFYEDLMFLSENPVNLNQVKREELEKFPFLSDIQVENILSYIYRFGALQTIFELQLIDGLDMTDIRRLLPFVTIGDFASERNKVYWADLLKYSKNELLIRFDRGLNAKEGYRLLPEDAPNASEVNAKKYAGSPFYQSLKYRYHFKDRILGGFTTEKDAGEPFWGKTQKGYDFYSGYVQLNDFGKFKTFVAGDFRANFGQGLVLRTDFGMGKSSYVLNVTPRNSGLKKYSSTDEYNFFRGAGATIRINKFDITAFYSNKMIDGDTLNGSFTSIYKTGLHRTLNETNKKHNVNQQVAGSNITFNHANFQIGFTAVHTLLNSNIEPDKSVYNYFYFSGNSQTTGGLHYRMRWHKLNFFGETAFTNGWALATLNGFSFNPVSQVSLVFLQRYFSPEYDTFYATAFSETSRINNETGYYIGAEIRPFKRWKISTYADVYRFPWTKFGIDAPSVGKDYLLQADFGLRRDLNMFWRLKYEEKQSNLSGTGAVMPVLVPLQKASLRYQLNYLFGKFSFRNLIEGNLAKKGDTDWTYGITASQDISYAFASLPLKLDFRFQVFDAINYENRFYSYEKDILYAFSIPMYYGLGSRYYLNLRYEPTNRLSFWFKIGQTTYADDREIIGSGNETIQGNRKTDVRFLLKWNF